MSLLNLNGEDFKSKSYAIFNNGVAGKVENVSINIDKKQPTDADNAPDYRINFIDANGTVNMGVYYPSSDATEQQVKTQISKALSITRAVMGDDYVFESVNSAKEAIDLCMKVSKKNSEDAKVNVFVSYGTVGSPKKYLGVYKTFDFIEKTGSVPSKLKRTKNPAKPQYDDLLEVVEADEPALASTGSSDTSDWL